jgi:hypothetical protein
MNEIERELLGVLKRVRMSLEDMRFRDRFRPEIAAMDLVIEKAERQGLARENDHGKESLSSRAAKARAR